MTFYEYENSRGERIERDFPMGSAPQTIEGNGATFRRVLSAPKCIVDGGAPDVPFRSNALPKGWPWAKNHERLPNGQKGKPIFSGQRELKEAVTAARRDGEPVVYNEIPND